MNIDIYYATFYSYDDDGVKVGIAFGKHGFTDNDKLDVDPNVLRYYSGDEKLIGIKVNDEIIDIKPETLSDLSNHFDEINATDETYEKVEKIIKSGKFTLNGIDYKFIEVY